VSAMLYVSAYVASSIGLVWTLYMQATDGRGAAVTVGIALFVAGQLVIAGLASGVLGGLRDQDDSRQKITYDGAWRRLALGLELAGAVRALRR
ncbi:hypothetical protein, partial [Kribbella turkmenica]|uniref:hypothetical protein n=1 Tax=Kribbella turkmenica TaxID=2530375 RepID=UPI001F2FD340